MDDEGRPVFENVDLIEKFFVNIHRQILTEVSHIKSCSD